MRFGRLLAAAELHNPVSGRYEHYLCQDFPDDGDSILRQMHGKLFAEWLNFGLEQQERDIRLGLRWLGRTPEDGADLLRCVEKRASSLIPQQYRRNSPRLLDYRRHGPKSRNVTDIVVTGHGGTFSHPGDASLELSSLQWGWRLPMDPARGWLLDCALLICRVPWGEAVARAWYQRINFGT